MKSKGTLSRLIKALLIHLFLISLVTVAGVFGAAKVVENVLIREALNGEAAFFWAEYQHNPEFPLPKTMNLTGYFENGSPDFPEQLLEMESDFQRVGLNEKAPIVYKTEKFGRTLYLVFEEAQVSKLALYFGIAPLVLVLLVIYLPAFISFFLARRAVSPVLKVVKKIEQIKISKKGLAAVDFSDLNDQGNLEVKSLIDTFESFSERIAEFVERERNFSRYASHELRTPLSVFKVSLASLKQQPLDDKSQKIVERMEPVIDDMSDLIESLLLLSHEQNSKAQWQPIALNPVIKQVIDDVSCAFSDKQIQVKEQFHHELVAAVPEQVFQIVVSNLVRNAFCYSEPESQVQVTVGERQVVVKDQGIGMTKEQMDKVFQPFYRADEFSASKGFGLGLAIVDWLCQQHGWEVQFESEAGQGTQVTLTLPLEQVKGRVDEN